MSNASYSFSGTKHLVPLRWAWEHGARGWTREKREKFANDPVNHWPVEASLNRCKGARGLGSWLSPSGRCQYVARFFRITKKYRLILSSSEEQMFREYESSLPTE
ncbi:GmrSD restriction endonuclease domain-containing protein [Marinobacter sp. DUT-1]|uniref:GmrSD restriction endonuclease domain-containing protein n=1 Tax=Marinobacter sp. DUT-1 TaxID=3412037 RepID=UPI003D167D66